MDGVKGLLGSKKAMVGLLAIVCATALAFNGTIDADQWLSFVKVPTIGVIGGQAISDAAERFGRKAK